MEQKWQHFYLILFSQRENKNAITKKKYCLILRIEMIATIGTIVEKKKVRNNKNYNCYQPILHRVKFQN